MISFAFDKLSSATVYTPPPLASALVRALNGGPADRWLDPCVGTGAFLRALHGAGVARERIHAFDIERCSSLADGLAHTRRGVDFVAWADISDHLFDRIICNPPYLSLGRVPKRLRDAALVTSLPNGSRIRLRSNYWVAFLCRALQRLRTGGHLGFILPASWDHADYASVMRERIPRAFRSFDVFRTRDRLFGDVQDGCIVIVGRGFGEPHVHFGRRDCDTAAELAASLSHPAPKAVEPATKECGVRTSCERRFGDVAEVLIGGVTGDAHFFLLKESERRDLGLPLDAVRPVLTKARQLRAAEIGPIEWNIHLESGERIWLFDPSPNVCRHPKVKDYLSLQEERGGCHRRGFKVSQRDPWYRVPLPARIDGFLSGMSIHGPWLSLRTMPRLAATNTLYIVRFKSAKTIEEMAAWSLALLSSRTRTAAFKVGRIYADGLLKFEPRDLAALPLPVPATFSGARNAYRKAVTKLLSGDHDGAQAIADDWVSGRSRRRTAFPA